MTHFYINKANKRGKLINFLQTSNSQREKYNFEDLMIVFCGDYNYYVRTQKKIIFD